MMFSSRSTFSSGSAYGWLIMIVVFITSLAAPINQFKVPPMIINLSGQLGVTLAQAGWLMSVFSIVAIFLALPAGLIVKKIGMKTSGILALLCLIIGSFMGSTADTVAFLMISRILEGAGLCLIGIVAPTSISAWFPPERRGAPLGLWATWVPLGIVAMFTLSPIIGSNSWIPVWHFGGIYAIVALVLFCLFFKLPADYTANDDDIKESFLSIINNRDIWFLAIAFAVQNIIRVVLNTFLPNYLIVEHGTDEVWANMTQNVVMLVSMGTGAIAGFLSDKLGTRKHLLAWPVLIQAIVMALPFSCPASWEMPLMVIIGFFLGFVPTCTFAAAPEIMKKPTNAGIGLAIVAFGQNLGMFLGPGLFGEAVEKFGWAIAGYLVVPVGLVGFLVLIKLRLR